MQYPTTFVLSSQSYALILLIGVAVGRTHHLVLSFTFYLHWTSPHLTQ